MQYNKAMQNKHAQLHVLLQLLKLHSVKLSQVCCKHLSTQRWEISQCSGKKPACRKVGDLPVQRKKTCVQESGRSPSAAEKNLRAGKWEISQCSGKKPACRKVGDCVFIQ
jgi:hypothetical protein